MTNIVKFFKCNFKMYKQLSFRYCKFDPFYNLNFAVLDNRPLDAGFQKITNFFSLIVVGLSGSPGPGIKRAGHLRGITRV
jgi:hypothetical protein